MAVHSHNHGWHQCGAKMQYKRDYHGNHILHAGQVACLYYKGLSQILVENDSIELCFIINSGEKLKLSNNSDNMDLED